MKNSILWIDGKRAGSPSFVPGLRKKGYSVDTVSTGKGALAKLNESMPHVVVVNAASLRSSGKRICQTIRDSAQDLPILLIANPDLDLPQETQANVVLKLPFTIRKLVNRVKPLLPGNSSKMILAGPIVLDLERKQVRCGDLETQITPRLLRLLQIFMTNPGVVHEREKLFMEIWKTEYTGDTRTLDVHISWLRRAIEENPRKPKYLKTIRGVGYRLDIE